MTIEQIEQELLLMGYPPSEVERIARGAERAVADHPYMTMEYMLWLLGRMVYRCHG